MLVEHARNVLGIDDACHGESSSDGTCIISALACSLVGRAIDVTLTPGTRLAALYDGRTVVTESTTCNYGVDASWRWVASTGGMVAGGVDETGNVGAVERDDHPFFLATLYQPQLRSSADGAHPSGSGSYRPARKGGRVSLSPCPAGRRSPALATARRRS